MTSVQPPLSLIYLDEDVAYLLGALLGGGEIILGPEVYKLIVRIKTKNFSPEIQSRLWHLLEAHRLETVQSDDRIVMTFWFPGYTITLRILHKVLECLHLIEKTSQRPVLLMNLLPEKYRPHFWRGFADASGTLLL